MVGTMAKIDDSVKKKVPELRFPGFTDDWEERKLGELTTSFSGGTPSAGNSSYYKGDIPFIRSGEINSDKTELFLTEAGLKSSSAKMVSVGDILYALYGATSGEVGISQINGAINQAILAIKPCDGYNSHFLMQWLKLKKQKIIDQYLQGGQGNLSGSIVKNLVLKVPNFEEQKKIGAFFKQLDDTITLHQRKLDLLKEQKKGYLQKMFPKNGAKVPELRFAGFADDWEERKLGEHAKYRRGSFPQPYGNKEWYDGEGAMPFVQVVDVTNKLTLVENTKQKISKLAQSKSVFVPKGTVVVTLQGSIGRVAITQYDSFVDRTLLIFEDYEKETDERFWAYTIQKKFEIEKLKAPGGTIKTITKEALSSFDVHLPQFKEQAKIGSFFKQLDDTIALHQRKLDLLKEQKKGFLQKMFV
ncbi:restriction endonuclease subunit S [Lactococcus cremoris]|uniref:restriction endonuclease subunit S n=1 Tax=Lactococcus lactis subsp. cremoris TaxID=1359 RepID=UPI003D0A60FE